MAPDIGGRKEKDTKIKIKDTDELMGILKVTKIICHLRISQYLKKTMSRERLP